MMYSLVLIWGDFLMLLTYGVISPLAGFTIMVSIISQINLLRKAICRYHCLQYDGLSDIYSVPRDKFHLENISKNCQENFHAVLWPGKSLILNPFS